jgi:transcriptional regulator with XRE-family HTH domain
MTIDATSLAQVVGTNIMLKRKVRGLTQEQLAELVGIEQQSLSRMEKGRIAPRFDRLQRFADVLHCPASEFFRVPGEGAEETWATIMDIIRPLSVESQKSVISVAAEMARTILHLEEKL